MGLLSRDWINGYLITQIQSRIRRTVRLINKQIVLYHPLDLSRCKKNTNL